MRSYQHLLRQCLLGDETPDRTGVGTRSIFGYQIRFENIGVKFPLVTTKSIHWKSVVAELLWLLSGSTNVAPLQAQGVRIWNEWADANGELGPVYGKQWRDWGGTKSKSMLDRMFSPGIDQMAQLVERLKTDPTSRRHVVSAWNVTDLPKMSLAPCHCLFQFRARPLRREERMDLLNARALSGNFTNTGVTATMEEHLENQGIPKYALDSQLYQRSGDVFLGVPFNIASYALLTLLVAQVVNMVPGDFIWTGGDVHLYQNHVAQAEEQLGRLPKDAPRVVLNPEVTDLFAFTPGDITLEGYDPWPAIKATVAV